MADRDDAKDQSTKPPNESNSASYSSTNVDHPGSAPRPKKSKGNIGDRLFGAIRSKIKERQRKKDKSQKKPYEPKKAVGGRRAQANPPPKNDPNDPDGKLAKAGIKYNPHPEKK